jgi:DNA repair exonuclease SbcCD nuclease subunit
MRVALTGDLHFGVKDSDKTFQNSQFEFMAQMVMECKAEKISEIFILGDLFDTRHSLNVLTLDRVIDFFLDHEEDEVTFHILLGNHDLYYKNSLLVNSLKVLRGIRNIRIYDHPKQVGITHRPMADGNKMVVFDTLVVPWVTDYEQFRNEVIGKYPETKRIFGHFDVIGAKMDNFQVSENGFEKEELLNSWQYVYSGHYHHHSETVVGDKRLVYIGSPYQITRAEIEPKGYYILDTDDESLTFKRNTCCIEYKKLTYPEFPEDPDDFITGNIVDVEISWEDSKYMNKVNEYLERIEGYNPAYPVNAIYQKKKENASTMKIDASKITILSLGKKYIDDSQDIKNKAKVYSEFKDLYSKYSVQ